MRSLMRVVLLALVSATTVVLATPPTAHATDCRISYTDSPGLNIPENTLVSHPYDIPVQVPSDVIVDDLNVTLNMIHGDVGDLTVTLRNNLGFETTLIANRGGTDPNLTNTVLDDAAADSIAQGSAPFTGSFRPETPLSEQNGVQLNALAFTLGLDNSAGQDDGTLTSFTLDLGIADCDTDDDGVSLFSDNCMSVANGDQANLDNDPLGDACDPDIDNDLIANAADSCQRLPAPGTTKGCPTFSATITLGYSAKAYRGVVTAGSVSCQTGRAISVFKRVPGPDRLIGSVVTGINGEYTLSKTRRAGRYYAKSEGFTLVDVATCPGATSPVLRLR